VPLQHATIQAAINAAPSGATIYVDIGTYNEKLTITNKSLTFIGSWRENCVIQSAEDIAIQITGSGSEKVVFQNFDVKSNSNSNNYRQCFGVSGVDLSIINCYLSGKFNISLIANNSKLTVINTELKCVWQADVGFSLKNCSSSFSGLLQRLGNIDHTIDVTVGTVSITNSTIRASQLSWGECVRIYSGVTLNVDNCKFFRTPGGEPWNPNSVFHAGVGVNGPNCNLSVTNTWIIHLPLGINLTGGDNSHLKFENNIIENSENHAVMIDNSSKVTKVIDFGGGQLGSTGGNFFINTSLIDHFYIRDINQQFFSPIIVSSKANYWSYYQPPFGLDAFIYDFKDDSHLMKVDYGLGLLNANVPPLNNAAPFFILAQDKIEYLEDCGPKSLPNMAININDGNPNANQSLNFIVTNDNPGLFSAQPNIDASGTLVFTPAAEKNGTATVTVKLQDNGSNVLPSVNTSDPQIFTITINQVADAPISADKTISVLEDNTYTFALSDFYYSDADGDPLTEIVIYDASPFYYKLNGNPIGPNSHVTPQDITASHLTYTPPLNYYGPGLGFDFAVGNAGPLGLSQTHSINISVIPVNDKPNLADAFPGDINFVAGQAAVSIAPGINISDVDSPNMSMLKVSSPNGYKPGESLQVVIPPNSGINVALNNGLTLTLTGLSSISNYMAALQSITYNNSNMQTCAQSTINIQVKDQLEYSNVIAKTINLGFPVISNNILPPAGGSYCSDSVDPSVIIGSTPNGGSGSYSYQWQSSSTGSDPWTNILGANSKDYDPVAAQSTIYYRRIVSSASCVNSNNSNAIGYIIVGKPPVYQNIVVYGSTSICFDGGKTTLYVPVVYGVSYQWKKDGVVIPGATSNSYVINGAVGAEGLYIVEMTTCSTVVSNGVQISIFLDCHVKDYCVSFGQSSTSDFIDLVQLETMSNPSGNDGGYKSYLNLPPPLIRQAWGYTLYFSAGTSLFQKRVEYWKAWIDFNQDGDFEDAGEEIMSTSSLSTGTLIEYFGVPSNAVLGYTRMRVSMKSGSYPSSCEVFATGEVEDYIVNIDDPDPNNVIYARERAQPENEHAQQPEPSTGMLYPNPVKDILNIDLGDQYDNYQMTVVDVTGRIKYVGDFVRQITVSDWPAGIYMVTLRKGKLFSSYRFVKD
jgi:hypothetical protein